MCFNNKLFHKLCLVDGLVLEYIEWKVYLTEGNNFDPIEIICVVEYFESSCCNIIFWTGGNGHGGVKWVCGHKPTQSVLK